MLRILPGRRRSGAGRAAGLAWLIWASLIGATVQAEPPPAAPTGAAVPQRLTLNAAVGFALEHNPELAAQRQQHGIAAAGVVIARTYPFNPTWEDRIQSSEGPASAGITNRVALEELLLQEVELRHQGTYRRQQALATLSRTDWEIVGQEQTLAVRVLRACDTVVYRRQKLQLIQDTIRLDEEVQKRAEALFEGGLGAADVIVARSEVVAARALLGSAQTALTTAQADLSRALGVVGGTFEVEGTLEKSAPPTDANTLTAAALERRGDLRTRQAAEGEAAAALRLAVANRYGNPTLGPAFSYNETRVYFIGAQINVPLPLWNTMRGEIMQRDAERYRAALDARTTEFQVRQDVVAALTRLESARAWVEGYRKAQTSLEADFDAIRRLFLGAAAGVNVLSVVDIQRKRLAARDAAIDAQFEVSQALDDLAAAVGDPSLAIDLCPAPAPARSASEGTSAREPQARITGLAPGVLCLPPVQLAPAPAPPPKAPPTQLPPPTPRSAGDTP